MWWCRSITSDCSVPTFFLCCCEMVQCLCEEMKGGEMWALWPSTGPLWQRPEHKHCVILITKKATKWLTERCSVQRGYTGQWDDSWLSLDEEGRQEVLNCVQLTFGFFHLNFVDQHWPQITEIMESKTTSKGKLMHLKFESEPNLGGLYCQLCPISLLMFYII